MIFVLHSTRFCRKASCLPVSKVLFAPQYSARAAVEEKRKPPRFKEQPCLIIGDKSRAHAISINPNLIFPSPIEIPNNIPTTEGGTSNAKDIKNEAVKETKLDKVVNHKKLHKYCLNLSKAKLTSLVVVTTMGGYALAPGVFDPYTFALCSIGTALVSASANAINQSFEIPFDAQMVRTRNRVLVRGHLQPMHAFAFAALSGVAGLTLLASEVNGLTALLGGANLVLYTLIYTPLKRVSIVNTWVGSVVGAIPPLMGWAGCVGSIASPGAWIMSGILFAWQFPHFNALSWNLRPDYSKAGYRMMANTNPDLCRKTALRYTAGLMVLSYLAPMLDVTHWWFAVASTPLNAYFLYLAWQFRKEADAASSRRLFRFSLVHLPILMTMLLLSKKYWSSSAEAAADSAKVVEVKESNSLIGVLTKTLEATTA